MGLILCDAQSCRNSSPGGAVLFRVQFIIINLTSFLDVDDTAVVAELS